MSIENVRFVHKAIKRVKNAYSLPSDAKLADLLGVNPSTISAWKRRGNLDWKLIFTKCTDLSADYIVYGELPIFREEKISAPYVNPGVARQTPQEARKTAVRFVKTIENLPWPVETRRAILELYLRMVDEELRTVQEQQEPETESDD